MGPARRARLRERWRLTAQHASPVLAAAARPRGAAALAAVLAVALQLWGPPGGDAAAHLYQTQAWRDHGWQLWDNFWYSGRYAQVNYSLLYYPLAALAGAATVVGASAMLAAGAFAALVRRLWPTLAQGPVIAFALLLPLGVVAGTYPFMLGVALALAALATMARGRLVASLLLVAATALAHPLALVLVLVVLLGLALSGGGWWRRPGLVWFASGVVAVAAVQVVLLRAFAPGGARYPFAPEAALAIAVFCGAGVLLTRGLPGQRPLQATFLAYGAVAGLAFAVSSPLGGNVERLVLLMGTPLLLLPLAARRFRPRGIAVGCIALALAWQGLPAVTGWSTAAETRAQDAEFWYPVMAFLDRHHDPDYRVEVVATADNWEAYHLARRGVPLARGWFRQADFPVNEVLYGPLTAAEYRAWMRRTGVRYVLLPDDRLDRSAGHEADLLRARDARGRPTSGLVEVADVGGWRVFELPDPTPIATPKDRVEVLALTSDAITLRVARPGRYRLRLNYTPYWRVEEGAACVSPREPWGTELRVSQAGLVRIGFGVRLGSLVGAVLGSESGCGPPVHGPFFGPPTTPVTGSGS